MSKMSPIWIAGDAPLTHRLDERFRQRVPSARVVRAGLNEEPPDDALAVPVFRLDRAIELTTWLGRPAAVLSIGLWRGTAYLGPFRCRDQPGCVSCLLTRVAGSPYGPEVDGEGSLAMHDSLGDPILSPFALAALPELAVLEVKAHLGGRTPRTADGAWVLDDVRSELRLEPLVAWSRCPVCAPASSRGLPPGNLGQPAPPQRSGGLRAVDVTEIAARIEERYLSPRLGMVKEVRHDLQSPFGTSYLDLHLGGKRPEPCIGRTTSYARAQTLALLESLERYCGWSAGGWREVVKAPYEEVADRALCPADLGSHPDVCYDLPGFPFVRFRPDLPIDWAWGYSLRHGRPLLVPARYAAYGYPAKRSPAFAYEVSNGCALGSTLEEAVLHGILEVIERDSFLLTWYRRLAVPEVALDDLPDPGVRDLLRRIEFVTGSKIRAFLSTREHGVPSLFVVASSHSPDGPCTLAAAAAHPDLLQALKGALYELGGLNLRMQSILPERRAEALTMLEDPTLVRRMEDHALVNCLPEARERFSFLLDQEGSPLPFAEAASRGAEQPGTARVRQSLRALVDCILGAELDILVIDQTMDELRHAGMSCVKVIVPGFLSMTFGHMFRRTEELPRLRCPYPEARGTVADIGRFPHPFP